MLIDDELRRIVLAAKLYYEEDKTQQQIAEEMNISRPLVSTLLSRARELDIVNININDPFSSNGKLLDLLKSKFSIESGAIIPSIKDHHFNRSAQIYRIILELSGLIAESKCIGLGWGEILDQVIEQFPEKKIAPAGCTICPLIGNLNVSNRAYHTNELVRRLAEKTGATAVYLNAPAFPSDRREQDLFKETENYKTVQSFWDKMDSIFIAVDSFPMVPDLASAYRLSEKQLAEKIVGEVFSYYFGISGTVIIGDQDYAVRIPLERVRKIKNVVGIIPQNITVKAIYGALKTGLISHVIMEERAAKELIYEFK